MTTSSARQAKSGGSEPAAGRTDRHQPVTRVLLGILALTGLIPGGWAATAPESFYSDFPAIRSGWVSDDGPFNEHLLRDVGAFFLALGILAGCAAISGRLVAARLAGIGWLVFSGVHAGYHLTHLYVYSQQIDRWLNAASMMLSISLALAVLLIPGRRRP